MSSPTRTGAGRPRSSAPNSSVKQQLQAILERLTVLEDSSGLRNSNKDTADSGLLGAAPPVPIATSVAHTNSMPCSDAVSDMTDRIMNALNFIPERSNHLYFKF
ncbi:uncharacterized protein LOC143265017 [Megachile rotundata]|uniref:uncharacterized protein LOC143265017 n=1 Tax=Megachile rotundata TaxID=143995 RepID=UPI003FD078E0